MVLSTLFGLYPIVRKLFADAGYQGPQFGTAVAQTLPHLSIEIVNRSDQANGFAVLPMRWVVEGTLAWLNPVVALPRTLKTSIMMPSRPSASRRSVSCFEGSVMHYGLAGQMG